MVASGGIEIAQYFILREGLVLWWTVYPVQQDRISRKRCPLDTFSWCTEFPLTPGIL